MGTAFRVYWAALKDYYEEMFRLVAANLLWGLVACGALLLSWSGLAGANLLWVLAIPLVVTLPPATAGMFYLTNQVAHHKSVELGMFFEGFRKYFVKSWLWALLNVVALVILYTNLVFYGEKVGGQLGSILQGLFVGLGVMWCLIQLYVFPMLLEQQEPRLLLALRNAALMAFASPIATLVLGVLLVATALLSLALALPFAVALMAVVCLAANEAVLTLLVQFGIRKPPEEVVPE